MSRRHAGTRSVAVAGSHPHRRVAITYQRRQRASDRPERERRHGWVLLFTWPVFAGLSLILTVAWIQEPSLGSIIGPFAVLSGLYAVGYLVKGLTMRKRGTSNLAGRHSYVGIVLD